MSSDYNFVTDRLAIGDVASRATPGFVAVVSLLATAPWAGPRREQAHGR